MEPSGRDGNLWASAVRRDNLTRAEVPSRRTRRVVAGVHSECLDTAANDALLLCVGTRLVRVGGGKRPRVGLLLQQHGELHESGAQLRAAVQDNAIHSKARDLSLSVNHNNNVVHAGGCRRHCRQRAQRREIL